MKIKWVLCCCFSIHLASAAPKPEWQPAHTWVFVVGTLKWKDAESFAPFEMKFRRDAEFVEVLKRRGLPSGQIVYLRDEKATLKAIESAFVAQVKQIPRDDLLILYYCGHGYKSDDGNDVYFAPYDAGDERVAGWSVGSIARTLKETTACKHVLWFADCCYSGQAAAAVEKLRNGPAFGIVTSSSASEESTGHFTFTEALLDAFNGVSYVDLNHDGAITLSEFAHHVEDDMNLAEEQLATFATTGGFAAQMVLSKARPLASPRVGERVKLKSEGEWYTGRIVETDGARLKVHYIGYEEFDADEWVTEDALRPIEQHQFAVGSAVEVRWKQKWYAARVLKVKGGSHLIHYDGFEASWDEWVPSRRIRESHS